MENFDFGVGTKGNFPLNIFVVFDSEYSFFFSSTSRHSGILTTTRVRW